MDSVQANKDITNRHSNLKLNHKYTYVLDPVSLKRYIVTLYFSLKILLSLFSVVCTEEMWKWC